jgi:hypothetical protein
MGRKHQTVRHGVIAPGSAATREVRSLSVIAPLSNPCLRAPQATLNWHSNSAINKGRLAAEQSSGRPGPPVQSPFAGRTYNHLGKCFHLELCGS